MPWGAAAAAGIGAIGGVMSSKAGAKAAKQKSFLELPDYMKGVPEEMATKTRELMGRTPLTPEQRVAPWSPNMQAGVAGMANYGATNTIGGTMQGAGGIGINGIPMGLDTLNAVGAEGAPVNQGPNMANVSGMINNDVLDASITAALRDPYRNLTESAIPGSRLAQAASGNTGSARGAIGEAVLTRGYEDRAADVGAAMRGSAYDTALQLEASRTGQNAALEGSNQALRAGVGTAEGEIGARGAAVLGMANDVNLGNFGSMITAGGMETALDQSYRDINQQNFMFPQTQMDWGSGLLNTNAEQYGVRHGTYQAPGISPVSAGLAGASVGLGAWGTYMANSRPKVSGSAPNGNLNLGIGDYTDSYDMFAPRK